MCLRLASHVFVGFQSPLLYNNDPLFVTISYLVAFLCLVVPVGVWEMYVTSGVVHYPFNVVAALADHVRVFCM